jgi:WD40 repeat protein
VCGWSVQSGQLQFHYPCSHKGDFVAVDMCGSVVVSGSHDETVKLWQVSEQGLVIPELSIDVGDRVWALSVQPQGNMCCVGSAGYHQVPPLHVFDMEQ